jgi:hypothetical protein
MGDFGDFFSDIGSSIGGIGEDIFNITINPDPSSNPILQALGLADDPEVQERVQGLVNQGVDASTAAQQAALERQRALLSPFQQAGITATGQLQQFAGAAQPLSLQALEQLGTEALAPPGLSPGEEFQLAEQERGLGRLQASRGQLFSGRAGEELLELGAGRISARSEADRRSRLENLAQLAPNIQAGLASGGQGASVQGAGFEVGGGRDIGETQLFGATTQAGLHEQTGAPLGGITQLIPSILQAFA